MGPTRQDSRVKPEIAFCTTIFWPCRVTGDNMLSQLTINNYAIVDYLDITLSPGMTVITGETGAGKSIMLDALGLTLGDRADREVIREGAERADIAASFNIATNPGALNWLQDHDFDADEKEC